MLPGPSRIALLALTLLALAGCSTSQIGTLYQRAWQSPEASANQGRDIFLTLDGTSNTPIARTNAARLFEIVDSHSGGSDRQLATYYAEGVGSNGNPLGLIGGLGIADDIRNAFEFLTIHYRPGDRIFLSGFSRGAYAARAVGGLVATAGIPDLSGLSSKDRAKIVRKLSDAYAIKPVDEDTRLTYFERRQERIRRVLSEEGIAPRGLDQPIEITAMALWDTVAALGGPDRKADPREEVPQLLLTNCNVGKVFHALALDDNRSTNYTPVFADAYHIYAPCNGDNADGKVEEVWFAGSHSDTGGAYVAQAGIIDHMPGVSLNWILERFEAQGYDLFPKGTRVFADPFGAIHNGREGSKIYELFKEVHRRPIAYQEMAYTPNPGDEGDYAVTRGDIPLPSIHASALARLAIAKSLDAVFPECAGSREPDWTYKADPSRKFRLLCSRDYEQFGLLAELRERDCLEEDANGYRLKPGQLCVKVVGEPPRIWPDLPGSPIQSR